MHKTLKTLLLGSLLLGVAQAHDFWLKPSSANQAVLHYGHGSEDEGYSAKKIKNASGLNAQGQVTPVKLVPDGERTRLVGSSDSVQLGVELDDGFWVKTTQGWKNQSKRQVNNALISQWSLSYTKVLLKPEACLKQPLGHQLEIVAVQWSPKSTRIRVLHQGKALAGVKVYANHKKVADSDSLGEATIAEGKGLVLSVSHRHPLKDNPDADRLNLHAVLTLP
mgnify:CR=1 FL=1